MFISARLGAVPMFLLVAFVAVPVFGQDAKSIEASKNIKLLCDPKVDVTMLTFNGAKVGGKIEDVKSSEHPSANDLKNGSFDVDGIRYDFDEKSHVIQSITVASRARGEMQDVQSVAAAEALFGKADEIRPGEDPEEKRLIYRKRGLDVFLDKEDPEKPALKLYSITLTLPEKGK